MIKYIFLSLLALSLIGGYMVYKYISEKKDQFLKVEKQVDNSTKIPPTENTTPESQFVTIPDSKTPITKTPSNPLTTTAPTDSKIIESLTFIATAQVNYENQTGRFSNSIKSIEKDNANIKKITNAISKSTELNGYSLKEITNDKDTDDTRSHYGVLATPINQSGKSYLLLMDLDKIGAYDTNGKESDGIDYYESTIQGIQLKSWPTPTDLLKWKSITIKSNKAPKPAPKVFEYNNADDEK